MRDILTALAAIVAVALLALMVGPHFVDWDAQRPRIAALIRDHVGIEARIGGPLRVSLLPVPELDAEVVELGTVADPTLRAARITFSLSPTALLTGRLVLTAARADKPELSPGALRRLIGEDGLSPAMLSRFGQIGIEKLDLRGARLVGAAAPGDAGAGRFDIVLEAPSLLGPYRIDIRDAGGARDFRAQIGRLEQGRARMKGVVEDKQISARIALDGWFALPGVAGRPIFDGSANFSGNPAFETAGGAHLPFQGSARLTVHTDQAIADPVNATLGTGETALQLSGQAFLDISPPRPVIQAKLAAKRLDLAPFSGLIGGLTRGLKTRAPFDLALELELEAVQAPGATIRNLALKLGAGAEGPRLEAFSALLPGATTARFERSSGAGGAFFDGDLMIEAGDLQSLAGWLRGTEGLASLPAKAALSARLEGDPSHLALRDLAIRSPAGDLAGSGVFEGVEPGKRALPKLSLDLAAERFDARVLAALDPLRPVPGLQLATRLGVRALALDGQDLGGLRVALDRDGETARLRELRLAGRNGEELTLSGNSAGETLHFTAKLDAERLGDIARLSAALLPGPVTAGFLRRAAFLEPAIAVGNFRVTSRAGEAIWDIALDGKLGGTTVSGKSQSAVRGTEFDLKLDGELANPDGGRLAAQLTGVKAAASALPGRLKVQASGNPRRVIDGRISGMLAGVDLDFEGKANLFRPNPAEGTFTLAARDLSLLGQALGGGSPPLAPGLSGTMRGRFVADRTKLTLTGFDARFGDMPVSGEIAFDFARNGQVAGQLRAGAIDLPALLAPALGGKPFQSAGAWSRAAFGPGLPPLLSGDLWIEAARLRLAEGLDLEAPQFILRFAPETAGIAGLEAKMGEGRIGGQLSLLRKGGVVEAGGALHFARIAIPGLGGRMSGEIPFTASGETPLALVATLSGAGKIVLDGIAVAEADPAALARVVALPLEALEPINENTIGGRIETEMRKGGFRLPAVERPLGLLNGQVRIGGVAADDGEKRAEGISLTSGLLVDLVRRAWEAKFTLRQALLPKGWRGAVPEIALTLAARLDAPEGAKPRRTLQVASLVNGFLAMAIQRDLERAEAFEADLREREAQLRRQRGDAYRARREQEIRDVEEAIALEARALRRRAEHAAELERQRVLAEKQEQERQAKLRLEKERLAREKAEREKAEREAAELAARTRARLEEERLRQIPGGQAGGGQAGGAPPAPQPGAPLELAPKVAPRVAPAPVPEAPPTPRG